MAKERRVPERDPKPIKRDRPVEQEGDKDIKEGGMEGGARTAPTRRRPED